MLSPGRVCRKTKGSEKGNICVILESIDDKFAIIDGNVRRRKCNIKHLQPLDQVIGLDNTISREDVKKELSALGYEIHEKRKKSKENKEISQGKKAGLKKESEKTEKKPKKESKKVQKEKQQKNDK